MKQFFKNLWKKIIGFFKKLFWRKPEIIIAPIKDVEPSEMPIPRPPPPLTEEEQTIIRQGRRGKRELFECFYGTLVDRVPETGRKRHLHDGWREGHSNPFTLKSITYDVQKTTDLSLELFLKLMEQLTGMAGE